MANILGTAKKMQEMFDLKGSTHNRGLTKAQEAELEQGKTKYAQKDNDFIKKRKHLLCSKKDKEALDAIIKKDVQFFVRNNIIDYSLLVGIHRVNRDSEKNSWVKDREGAHAEDDEYDFIKRIESPDG